MKVTIELKKKAQKRMASTFFLQYDPTSHSGEMVNIRSIPLVVLRKL